MSGLGQIIGDAEQRLKIQNCTTQAKTHSRVDPVTCQVDPAHRSKPLDVAPSAAAAPTTAAAGGRGGGGWGHKLDPDARRRLLGEQALTGARALCYSSFPACGPRRLEQL
jgi:hypothetical protein